MRNILSFILLIILVLASCEELETPSFNEFVIEAFITADHRIDDIRIKKTSSLEDEEILDIPIENANVSLSNGERSIQLAYNANSAKYGYLDNDFEINVGHEYFLEVEVDGAVASSNALVPEKPVGLTLSDSILIVPELTLSFTLRDEIFDLFQNERARLSWDSIPGRSYFVVIEQRAIELDTIMPKGIPQESLDLLSSFRFISAPSEQNYFEIIAVALETYGPHVAKVYSVNQEYVDLFNSAEQDSRDLNEPPSNITNALGIFTAFAVDSLEFEVRRE